MKTHIAQILGFVVIATGFISFNGFKAHGNEVKLRVTSSVFTEGGMIPAKYSCFGQNINPPLTIEGVPDKATSIAIIVEDPDAPKGIVTHWIAWDMPPHGNIMENNTSGTQGQNERKGNGYMGPCPPSGTHRYYFKVFALNRNLDLPLGSDRKALEAAMKGHIIGEGELMGKFSK